MCAALVVRSSESRRMPETCGRDRLVIEVTSAGGICLGLSNTCPQAGAARGVVAVHGQVSNKPKH